jgi:uncharacterized LabA/DUF88 family protein
MPDRVTLFIDHHNTYKGARESFFPNQHLHFTDGQIDPIALGQLLCDRPPPGFERVLHEVRIYTGRPDATREPKSYGPHMRQMAKLEKAGVRVFAHPLRYPPTFPDEPPKEKGVDVHLAIDVVRLAIEGEYDVGIVLSTDTDLRPAVEYVTNKYDPVPRVEVAAWSSATSNRRIPVSASRPVWCHYLKKPDYESVHDPTDYTLS